MTSSIFLVSLLCTFFSFAISFSLYNSIENIERGPGNINLNIPYHTTNSFIISKLKNIYNKIFNREDSIHKNGYTNIHVMGKYMYYTFTHEFTQRNQNWKDDDIYDSVDYENKETTKRDEIYDHIRDGEEQKGHQNLNQIFKIFNQNQPYNRQNNKKEPNHEATAVSEEITEQRRDMKQLFKDIANNLQAPKLKSNAGGLTNKLSNAIPDQIKRIPQQVGHHVKNIFANIGDRISNMIGKIRGTNENKSNSQNEIRNSPESIKNMEQKKDDDSYY